MNRSGMLPSRFLRAGALAASALVSVAVLTGCGGSGDSDSAADTSVSPSASAAQTSAAASAVKPLTAAELKTASLTAADVPGYKMSTAPKAQSAAIDAVEVSGEECGPLGRAVAGAAVGEPAEAARVRVTGNADTTASADPAAMDVNIGMVTLASYSSADEAAAALKSVTDAVTACASGFEWTVSGETTNASKVTGTTAPEAGEEAVAFTATAVTDGDSMPCKVAVFRVGATLAHFTILNMGAMATGEDFTFPTGLVTAQADKLA